MMMNYLILPKRFQNVGLKLEIKDPSRCNHHICMPLLNFQTWKNFNINEKLMEN
eukprot:TRINITY_DN3340_c0_g1_i1.p2 TRINITY_DN3340_c0_g1~~TRINITY_DN3340_c0_g1_i1.p2  ORF type:complete len:54 (-),score=3.47 TRINITY_DN3340_c0_g1_i1:177-338(-)